jgi:hypothetical protein
MLGFKRFSNARRVLAGVDLVQKIVKGIRLTNHTGDTVAEFRRLVSSRPGAWG